MAGRGKKAGSQPVEVSFEAALERLEEIVDRIEGEELELTESLALFEEGVRLVRTAEQHLGGAQVRLEQLLEDGESFRMQPFPEES